MIQDYVCIAAKVVRTIKRELLKPIDHCVSWWVFYSNNVKFSTFSNRGWPKVSVSRHGKLIIGNNFRSNNREMANPIGRFHPCSLVVSGTGTLIIGRNVGMSAAAIVCHNRVEIGDNVNLGGGVVIYDTDFHSLDFADRISKELDLAKTKTGPVTIGDNAFIGAHTTILKGVSIGKGAVVGACSVVTHDVPENEIWAGNPASYLRKIHSLNR